MAVNTISRRSLLATSLFAQPRRPNFVFVLVDDLRWDELGCTGHPFAQTPSADRLAREGANFTDAFCTTPLCSPSRATFLTGRYAHAHGIRDNVARDALSHKLLTWPRILHDAGYATAFMGKWHMGNDDSPRPGFDRWVSFRGQGECINPDLNVNGMQVRSAGYVTDILTDYAAEFIRQRRDKPFCLYVAHKAIHPNVQQRDDGSVANAVASADAFIPAARHRNLYSGRKLPRRPNYARPPAGKPALQRRIGNLPPLGPKTVTDDPTILNRMRMMKAVDESLGRLIDALGPRLDDTVVIFTSDHGYFYGEHCLGPERRLAYEETIRIPLLIRYPRRFKPGSRPDQFASSVDIASTVFELAGVAAPAGLHGYSLLSSRRRGAVLIEYFSDAVFPRILKMGYQAVRTREWKYIHYTDLPDSDELYHLSADPYEQQNRLNDGAAAPALANCRRLLQNLLQETGA
jgi:N-acetylglucosamine-6-sulfatase